MRKQTPWQIEQYLQGLFRVRNSKTDKIVCQLFTGETDEHRPFPGADDNKHKIAAAPEMLQWLEVAEEMLLQCMKYNEFTIGACKNMTEIAKVIAKAKGEA